MGFEAKTGKTRVEDCKNRVLEGKRRVTAGSIEVLRVAMTNESLC